MKQILDAGLITGNSIWNRATLNRKKTNPDEFVFIGEKQSEESEIQLYQYSTNNCAEKSDLKQPEIPHFSNPDEQYWLNVHGIADASHIVALCKNIGIHDLIIQDILDMNQRPKWQEFKDHAFLTIKTTVPTDDEELHIEQISFVFGSNYLVSFQERKADYFDHIRYRLKNNTGVVRSRKSDFLLYLMLESILDNYFKTLQLIEKDADSLSFLEMNKEPSPDTLRKIEKMKRHVLFIRRAIQPIKEAISVIERGGSSFVEKKNVKYFLELKDLCLTLLDNCDTLHTDFEGNINLFFSIQGHRMNQVMKTLTIVATVFIPLTFVAGIYGMNFNNMPELQWKYGYLSVWIVMLALTFVMFVYFKKKKWF